MRHSYALQIATMLAAASVPSESTADMRMPHPANTSNVPLNVAFTTPLRSSGRRRRGSAPSQAKLRRQRRRGGR